MGNKEQYFIVFLNLLHKPYSTLKTVKESKKKLAYAFYTLFLFSAFAMTNMLCYHFSRVSLDIWWPPFIRVSEEFVWILSFFLMIPVAILGAIMYAGIIQILSKLFGGKGNFESQFALFLFSYPLYFIILHIIKFVYFLFTHESLGGYVLMIFAVFSYVLMLLSVKIEQEIKWFPAILISLPTTAIVAFFSMTYIR